MKYLQSFSKQLRFFRETHKLSLSDIANLCSVDESVVKAWEDSNAQVFPSLENLLDICFKTGASLEYFLDVPSAHQFPQLDLPGIDESEFSDLSDSLNELDKHLDDALPKQQELALIKRFRKSDPQNQELILQLMGL
ncbi:hypothetical protein A3762_03075 [Oleiphilus sp. HI0125]|uniref:helix-turn-helix domain-containing protein n=1 Tax=Oleiphilus sp. HI0125 TaxID=1822266 RepID=UPI0007C33AEC|nr:helix-turn-helix transcriptional regulator [Oleiphilus sp. HI0125]KZZ60646.1 hypothetical protein A3762_03075 [Oleiphilus sp. HI0125]